MRGPYRTRRINRPPQFNHFKPAGVPARSLQTIILTVDEYEALRLADYQNLEHQQAADQMNISRPTFTRLIEKARKKIALAIIEGQQVIIDGGNFYFSNNLLKCLDCGDLREYPMDKDFKECPHCGSGNINNFAANHGADKSSEKTKKK